MRIKEYKNYIYWLIPSLVYLFSSLFSVINVDGVRDYLEAYTIASATDFTLVGPQMAFSFHVAPIWYYFLSLPLLFSKPWLTLSIFVTFLSAFKYYYAYKLGKIILDKQYAIFLVSTIMLASFTVIQQITFTHTNLIEAAILFIIYFTLTFEINSNKQWFYLGFIVAIALHIHPTTAIVSFWVIPKLFKSKSFFKSLFVTIQRINA